MNLLWLAPPLVLVPAFVFWYQRKAQRTIMNSYFYEWESANNPCDKQYQAKILYLNDFAPEMADKIEQVWQASGAPKDLYKKIPEFLNKRKSLQSKGNIEADAQFYDEECKMLDAWIPYEFTDSTQNHTENYIIGLQRLFFPDHLSHYVTQLSSQFSVEKQTQWLEVADRLKEWAKKLEANHSFEDVLNQKNEILESLKK
jgi:hypothetical protein